MEIAKGREKSGAELGTMGRHCMVVHAYYPLGETRVEREAHALMEAGFDVTVLCLRLPGEAAEEDVEGVQVVRLPVRRRKGTLVRQLLNYMVFLFYALVRLPRLNRVTRFTSVQVHNIPDFLVFCTLPLKLQNIPVILDIHDLMPEFFAAKTSGSWRAVLGRGILWQEKLACKFADHVITVSDHWRRALNERGVPWPKISVVMNLADARIFSPPQSETAYLPRSDALNLIYHGIVVERYGLDLVLVAMRQLRKDGLSLRLTILGDGDYLATLKKMVAEFGLDGHVVFGGVRLATELPAIIRKANLGVVPYRNDVFTDSLLPTKLMEYAAMGLPAVAARTTAIEAYFRDTMVEFFEPGEADDLARCLRELCVDRPRLLDLARGCERFNRAFNWENEKRAYVALIQGLIGGEASKGAALP